MLAATILHAPSDEFHEHRSALPGLEGRALHMRRDCAQKGSGPVTY